MGHCDSQLQGQITTEPDTLIIGDLIRWKTMGRVLPELHGMAYATIGSAKKILTSRLQPKMILSPLMSGDFDAFDVALMLNHVGFCGLYRTLVSHVPDVGLISREINLIAPDLNFAIFDMSAHVDQG